MQIVVKTEHFQNGSEWDFKLKFKAHASVFLPPRRLNFQFCPSSKIHGFFAVDLKPNGDDEVTAGTRLSIFIQDFFFS